MVAGAVIVGACLSIWASTYGIKLSLDNFVKSLFYYLFMYGVGLRVGPSFVNSLRRRRPALHDSGGYRAGGGPGDRRPGSHPARPAGGRRRWSPGWQPDHVGGDRFGRTGDYRRRGEVAGRHDAGSGQRHDCRFLRHQLHLGHGRHHSDRQVPAALVGRECAGRGQEVRGRVRREERRRCRPVRLPARRAARLPAGQPGHRRQEHRAVSRGQSRIPRDQRAARR